MGDGGGEVLSYHRLSMHRPERYAPGPGGLDWATQPAPFRQYRGCRQVELLHRPLEESPPYDGVFSGPAAAPSRLDRRSLSQMLYDGLALSAWKEAGGTRWALRVNPSSGNLHPTEAYLLLPGGTLEPAPLLAHYRPDKHALEVRGELPAPLASLLDDCLPAVRRAPPGHVCRDGSGRAVAPAPGYRREAAGRLRWDAGCRSTD